MNLTLIKPCIDWCTTSIVQYEMQYISLIVFAAIAMFAVYVILLYATKDDTPSREMMGLLKYSKLVVLVCIVSMIFFLYYNSNEADAEISKNVEYLASRIPDDSVLYDESKPIENKWKVNTDQIEDER